VARPGKSAGRRGPVRKPSGAAAPRNSPARRWPRVVVVVLCLAMGAVVLERLSRPREQVPPQPASQAGPVGEGSISANDLASVARLTLQELIEEARQLAARLQTLPESAEALNLAGSIYEAVHDPDKAVDCWERTVKVRPDSPEVHFNLGSVAWQMGDFEKAKSHFLKSHALSPDLGQLRYYLADSLLKLGEASQAIAALEGAKDLDRYGAKGRCVLGHAYAQGADFEKARENFEAALALDPKHVDAHYGLIKVMTRLNQPEKARKHRDATAKLQQAKRQADLEADRPGEVAEIVGDVGYMRRRLAVFCRAGAEIYSRLGHGAEAERLLVRAAALWPEDPEFSRSRRKGPEQAPAP